MCAFATTTTIKYSGHRAKHEHVLPSKPRAGSTNRSLACIMIHQRINLILRAKVLIIHLMKMMMVRVSEGEVLLCFIVSCCSLSTLLF